MNCLKNENSFLRRILIISIIFLVVVITGGCDMGSPGGSSDGDSSDGGSGGGGSNPTPNPSGTAPTINSIDPPRTRATTRSGETITVYGTEFTNVTRLTLDGSSISFTIVNATTITFNAPNKGVGSYSVIVTNSTASSNGVPLEYVSGPIISSIKTTADGISIDGVGFTDVYDTPNTTPDPDGVSVDNGATATDSENISDTQMTADITGLVDGQTYNITVTSPFGTDTESYTHTTPLDIQNVTPTRGTVAGGTIVTITSSAAFPAGTEVYFGSNIATAIVIAGNTITCRTPAGSTSNLVVDIIIRQQPSGVETVYGTKFTYLAKIYWSVYDKEETETEALEDRDVIQRSNLDGTSLETIFSERRGIFRGVVIDEDANDKRLYWTDVNGGRIIKSNLLATRTTELIVGLSSPTGLAIDQTTKKLYWSEQSGGKGSIKRSNLDGSNIETIVSQTEGEPQGIAIDTVNDKVYWCEISATSKIQRANLTAGATIEPVITVGVGAPYGIALDTSVTDKVVIYWTDGDATIEKARVEATNNPPIVEERATIYGDESGNTISFPREIILNPTRDRIAWMDRGAVTQPSIAYVGTVSTASFANISAVAEVFRGPICGGGWGISYDNTNNQMYFTAKSGQPTSAVWRQAIPATFIPPALLAEKIPPLPEKVYISIDKEGGRLYWDDINSQRIYSSDLTGDDVRTEVDNQPNLGDISIDFRTNKDVYYVSGAEIRRARLDYPNAPVVTTICDIDDGVTSRTYSNGNYDEAGDVLAVTRKEVRGISVDTQDDRIFWNVEYIHVDGETEEYVGRIFSASMTPGAPNPVETNAEGFGGPGPDKFTLKLGGIVCTGQDGKAYWVGSFIRVVDESEVETRKIRRMTIRPLQGGTQIIDEENMPEIPEDTNLLAVDAIGSKMYWSTASEMKSSNLDGTGEATIFSRDDIFDIALEADNIQNPEIFVKRDAGGIEVRWWMTNTKKTNIRAFHIWKKTGDKGAYKQITKAPIAFERNANGVYTYRDRKVHTNTTYYYKLQGVFENGTKRFYSYGVSLSKAKEKELKKKAKKEKAKKEKK